ncbi:MAG: DUF4091 domain-containing protein [Dysgonamonadaceae bacterium]|nr:DUF4091 domain-containing protein [Dysgonamonadaceae bacterium]
MKKKIYLNLFAACLLIALSACKQTNEKENIEIRVMDSITEIPEWLKTTVEAALPSDSLNVWIPTGELSTSSLIRAPRFPSLRREDDTEPSPFDIHPLNPAVTYSISGVRNEQQSFQIAVASMHDITGLSVEMEDLISNKGDTLDAGNIKIRYVRYVPVQRARSEYIWTSPYEDVYNRKEISGFGVPNVVADPLMDVPEVDVPAYRAQPVWFTLQIPASLTPGTYQGMLHIHTGQYREVSLRLAVNVLSPVLPSPRDYRFFLDLWFNPNAVAAVNGLETWSEAHWKQIDLYLKDLASRGAKTVTTTIVPYPWKVDWLGGSKHSQTYIGYPEMVQWLRDASGNWSFDYSIFDRFVATCFRHGIDRRIDAFSLTPFDHKGGWKILFCHKENGAADTLLFNHPDEEYKKIWKTFLRDFESHLTQKGWLNKTYLSFDESPREVLDAILDIVSDSAPVFLKQFAIAGKIDTESLAASHSIFYTFLPERLTEGDENSLILKKRRNDPDKTTTFYLCGEPAHPNTFAYSPAIEARMIPWLAAFYKLDGYLRWAYNSWTDMDTYSNPVFNFIQGDDYYVYPGKDGPVSSIRWELLKEGIEDYELLRVIGSPQAGEAIERAVRNRDGRKKCVTDFEDAREIVLK